MDSAGHTIIMWQRETTGYFLQELTHAIDNIKHAYMWHQRGQGSQVAIDWQKRFWHIRKVDAYIVRNYIMAGGC